MPDVRERKLERDRRGLLVVTRAVVREDREDARPARIATGVKLYKPHRWMARRVVRTLTFLSRSGTLIMGQ